LTKFEAKIEKDVKFGKIEQKSFKNEQKNQELKLKIEQNN